MDIRNIAIIAHVDHGKTTLVDFMLKQTHTFRDNQAEMTQTTILDSNDLEREKGITILAKNTAVLYGKTKINIIDTPGHADFSGEVERVLNMADGALLIVDSAEGPLPQTQFVLTKALENNLKIILVINKIDRKDARPKEVLHETEELFLHLASHEDHLHFPVIYAVGREGKAWDSLPEDPNSPGTLEPLFQAILKHIPPPAGDVEKPFKMLVSTLDFDSYKGSYAIGKVTQGTVKSGQSVVVMYEQTKKGQFKIEKVYESKGLARVETEVSCAGDIIAVTGIPDVAIGQTLTDPSDQTGYPGIKPEEPTLKIVMSANTSPFAGREGKFSTARQLEQRLIKEKQSNIGMKIDPNQDGNGFIICGRGELHIAILLETLRREGYEFQVGKPEVITKIHNGVTEEPYEEMIIEIDSAFIGVVSEELGKRRAELLDSHTNERNISKIVYKVSSRNLLGFRGDILTKTRGNGIFNTRFIGYFPIGGVLPKLRNGVIISLENGKASSYALETLQERGTPFVIPGDLVYEGMVIGVNNRNDDIEMNACKTKKLTNIHSDVGESFVRLDQPIKMTIEQCLDFLEDDELLEITPATLRLRKRHLTHVDRLRAERSK
ncbi:translational GTPase TypA [Candidatus Gottesmanbacteria bacterium]|nr:translational GTPase TypA [Candidatus Gottesmanbacteria bacterium]